MPPAADDTTRSSEHDTAMKTLRLAVFVFPYRYKAPTTMSRQRTMTPKHKAKGFNACNRFAKQFSLQWQ
jgi:hypothetical protein